MSPCVATTRPSLTATLTPQPVPQNRHGAFDHFIRVNSESVTMFAADAGSGTPATAAAVAAADCLMNSRLVIFMGHLFHHRFERFVVLIDQGSRQHRIELLDIVHARGDLARARGFERHDQLAVAAGRVYLGAGQAGNRLRDALHAFRKDVNDDPGNMEFFAHEDSEMAKDHPPVGGPLMI